jgi:hypothetical protein
VTSRQARLSRRIRRVRSPWALAYSLRVRPLSNCASERIVSDALKSIARTAGMREGNFFFLQPDDPSVSEFPAS